MGTKYVHIGNLISEKLKEMHLKPADLARKLSYSFPGTTRFLKLESMQTKVLLRICSVLGYDFFRHYSDIPDEGAIKRLQQDKEGLEKDIERLGKEMEKSKQEAAVLQKEVAYLKKIVLLYERGKS